MGVKNKKQKNLEMHRMAAGARTYKGGVGG
jgi:hypothetical protein